MAIAFPCWNPKPQLHPSWSPAPYNYQLCRAAREILGTDGNPWEVSKDLSV
jgi:hypothetical protein